MWFFLFALTKILKLFSKMFVYVYRLSSVSFGGGDAGGGNATVTYSYTTFNDFTVLHPSDISASGGSVSGVTWWSGRSDYVGT